MGYFDFLCSKNLSSRPVVKAFKCWFVTHDIPETLCSQEGPQWMSKKLRHFSKPWNINVQISSLKYKSFNCLSESYIHEAKHSMSKYVSAGFDPYLSSLNDGNTPKRILGSPAQNLMARRTREILLVSSK